MKFEIDESSKTTGRIYARSSHEKGVLVVRTRHHGNFVLDRLEMAVSESMVDAVAAGEDIESRVIESDLTLSGIRRIIHGHGYVPLKLDKWTKQPVVQLPIHELLELEPTVSELDTVTVPTE